MTGLNRPNVETPGVKTPGALTIGQLGFDVSQSL